jgi:hypothetical protein
MPEPPAPPAPATPRDRALTERQAALLLGVVVLAVAILTVSPYPVGVFVDDGYYVILAKSLATGHGLRNLQLPGEPYATHFPPGYPVFLSLLWRLAPEFPQNVAVFKFANAGLLGLAAGLGYVFGVTRLGLSGRLAAPAVLFGTASIPALLLAGMVLSETLFLALLLATLLVAERAADGPTLGSAILVGVLCGILALVRTLGAVVLPVAAILLWRRGGWRCGALAMAAGFLVLMPWQGWAAARSGSEVPELAGLLGSYGGWLVQGYRELGWSGLWALPVKNAADLLDSLRVLLAPLLPLGVKDAFLAVAVVVWVAGARTAVRRAPISLGALLAYVGAVLMWPSGPIRFLWGIWLFVALLFALGVSAFSGWQASGRVGGWARRAALVACAAVAMGHLVYNVRGYRGRWWNSIPRAASESAAPLLRWAAERTRPNDVLVSDYDNMQYLYAGRRALPPYALTAAEHLRPPSERGRADALGRILLHSGARYLITSTNSVLRAAELLTARHGVRLVLIDTLGRGAVAFRVETVKPLIGAPEGGRR